MLASSVCNKGSNLVAGIKDHFQKYGKVYLVGIAVIGAVTLASFVRSNMEDTFLVRHGGGRVLSNDDGGALSSMEEIDPTPHLRYLSKLINK